MPVMLWQVDAFTDRPFAGNPAAGRLLDREADAAWMQAVAAEMNLAETAFAAPRGAGFGLRWFTPRLECRGVMVTAPSDVAGADFVSRFFAPAVGVDEDPVTGSAHGVHPPHWAAKLGKDRLDALQVSARGDRLRLALAGDRVKIAGQAVTVLRGELC